MSEVNRRRPISASAVTSWRLSAVLLDLLVLGDPPEDHHADAGRAAPRRRGSPTTATGSPGPPGCAKIRLPSQIVPMPWLTTVNATFQRNGTQSW